MSDQHNYAVYQTPYQYAELIQILRLAGSNFLPVYDADQHLSVTKESEEKKNMVHYTLIFLKVAKKKKLAA